MSGLMQDATGNDLTYRIIGAAMAMHNREEVYERALAAELLAQGIASETQYPVQVWDGEVLVAQFYLDMFIQGLVVVELKAFFHQLTGDELAQMINYLKATKAPVGLIFNFGRQRLEFRRVFPDTVDSMGRFGLL